MKVQVSDDIWGILIFLFFLNEYCREKKQNKTKKKTVKNRKKPDWKK